MKNRQEFFNQMAEMWDEDRRESCESYRRVVDAADLRPEHTVLDVGTGTGVLLPFLMERVEMSGEIHAIDYAENMIEKLKSNGLRLNVYPTVMDIHKADFADKYFDRVVANCCFPHFEDKGRALREVFRILKDNGKFVVSHPTGRKHVNEIHRRAHRLVRGDILPEPDKLQPVFNDAGFQPQEVIDEPEFFLMTFSKSR